MKRFRGVIALVALSFIVGACGSQIPEETFHRLIIEGVGPDDLATDDPRLGDPGLGPPGPGVDDPGEDTTLPGEGEGPLDPGNGTDPGDDPGNGDTRAPGDPADPQRPQNGQQEPRPDDRANFASDTGVTANEIRVGVITASSGPLGPVFDPMYHGANAYFQRLNAQGGVNGRTVRMIHCDDAMDRSRNRQCARNLVEGQEVFAFVGTATEAYASGSYIAEHGVPDIGQPISNDYWQWPTHYSITGSPYRRDGNIGQDGRLWGHTAQFDWMVANVDVSTVGVVFYDVPVSRAYGLHLVDLARHAGLEAIGYEVSAAFPNFDSVVANMSASGVDAIWDAMDFVGNHNLCRAMDRHSFRVSAKVHTSQGWTRAVRDFPAICRENLYATGFTRPASDTSHAETATFRDTIRRLYGSEYEERLHQWAAEGWAAAQLFTDGVRSMGADVTREGLIEWIDTHRFRRSMQEPSREYDGDGFHAPKGWSFVDFSQQQTTPMCIFVVRWDDSRSDFLPAGNRPNCFNSVDWIPWDPAQ